LYVDKPSVMDQQWVYFVDKEYPINRMAEFRNFNLEENQGSGKTVVCAEVTDHEKYTDDDLVSVVVDQLENLGMLKSGDIMDQKIIPIGQAYPIYDLNYQQEQSRLDSMLDAYPHIYSIGRQAQFKHQDIDEIYASAKALVNEIKS